MIPRPALRLTSWLMLVPVLAGCGSRGGTLSGSVTVDGSPLANGILMVHDATGGMLSTPVRAGAYELEGVPPGPARFAIRALPPPPMMAPPPTLAAGGGAPAAAPQVSELPESYADADRSGLQVTVAGVRQRLDLQLSSRRE